MKLAAQQQELDPRRIEESLSPPLLALWAQYFAYEEERATEKIIGSHGKRTL